MISSPSEEAKSWRGEVGCEHATAEIHNPDLFVIAAVTVTCGVCRPSISSVVEQALPVADHVFKGYLE